MLQLLQHQKSGEIAIKEVPMPVCPEGGVLVRVHNSLISAGTERMSVEKAKASLLERVRKQPDDVKMVLESVKKDGVSATLQKVKNTLESWRPLGYSTAGVVVESKSPHFSVGDRVACAGNAQAYHAEYNAVPANLTVKIPDSVQFNQACYTTLGAIALQGVRQTAPELGETIAVVGLGLLGQLTIQLLKANGVRVIGLDIDASLFELSKTSGCDATVLSNADNLGAVREFSRGRGVDAVVITAATSSDAPMDLALRMCRKKGRVVVVGAVGMNINRGPMYMGEIDVKISCSYGPGRYDPQYEEMGVDYPLPYVRWTENRNMEAFLDMVAAGAVTTKGLTTHSFELQEAQAAYEFVTGKRKEQYVGLVLNYDTDKAEEQRFSAGANVARKGTPSVGFVGAGAFAQSHLLPHFSGTGAHLHAVATSTPAKAHSVAQIFGFEKAVADVQDIVSDNNIDLVFCATRHDSHAQIVEAALRNNQNVFVEKPVAISEEELTAIEAALATSEGAVMVGFNRRFSESFMAIKDFFAGRVGSFSMMYRVNAGFIPPEHWSQQPEQGGRIIGEACHFIDCMSYISNEVPVSVYAQQVSGGTAHLHDNVHATIAFSKGSVGTLVYASNGDGAVPKEYFEAMCDGRTALMHNFRSVELFQGKRRNTHKFDGAKGHKNEVHATIAAAKTGGEMPIQWDSIAATTRATFAIEQSLQTGSVVTL